MLRIEGGMRAVLAPWRAAGDDEEDGIGIAWQKAVLSERRGVGLARLLLNQAGARVRACTGAVRVVLIDSSRSASASASECQCQS
jgi:GNAT superfamily N-acetyltransferase